MQDNTTAPELSPYDTTRESEEINALQLELDQNSASLEGDFAKFVSENLTPDQEVLMIDDKESFIRDVLLPMQNKFYQDQIASKQSRKKELEGIVAQKQSRKAYDDAVNEFKTTSKQDDKGFNEMMDFYMQDLSPRLQAKLGDLPPQEFFKELYGLYSNQIKQPQKPLPKEIQGSATNALDESLETETSPMDRF